MPFSRMEMPFSRMEMPFSRMEMPLRGDATAFSSPDIPERPPDALPQGEPCWVGLAFIGFSLLVCLLLAQTALGASRWTPPTARRPSPSPARTAAPTGALLQLDPASGANE
jgi:hypothetical protein